MKRIKKRKKHIILHPVMTYILLIIGVIILSGVLSLFNVSFTYTSYNGSITETVTRTESVNSLFNLSGVKYIFSNTVSNFANFTVLSNLIIVLLGIGVMEYTGFLKTAVGLLTKKASKKLITFTIVLIGILLSLVDNLPFIAFIPLTALIFKYGKRNPNLGVVTAYASLTCGYGLSLFLTISAATLFDPNYKIQTFAFILIMAVAIIALASIITYVTESYVAGKMPKYDFEDTEVLNDEPLTKGQLKGLVLAGIGSLAYLFIVIYNIIPGLPLSGNFLNYSETLYIDKLFGAESFFASGFVFIVTLLFIIWGLLYGIGAKMIKNNRDFVESLGYSLNGIGKTLVIIFAASTFISIFKQTNIGNVLTVGLTNFLAASKFTSLAIVVLLFIITIISTLILPGTLNKWAIMAPQIVPTFMNVGLSAEFAQVVFRFGECVSLGITPLFAYFVLYLAFLEKYNQNENNMGIFNAIKYQLPYILVTFVTLFTIIILWYIISIPLGVGGFVAL